MCGIAGLIDRRAGTPAAALGATARAMADAIAHRGPDGSGVWVDESAGVGLGHRRLSIIDLSETGAQPMVSASGRYVISYNGEVFNFLDLRRELEAAGDRFRGGSDTEVMLAGFARWGIEATAKRLIGMFALALWDRETRRLTLVRDRLGIKPLYYLVRDDLLLFGSELKALRAAPGWRPTLDRDALVGYLRHNYVAAPHSIYAEVKKLPPGHILTLDPGQAPHLTPFWDMREVARAGLAASRRTTLSDAEAVERLDALLRDSVRRRMLADVPLGAFLSGGIDSSTVVALMQAESNRPVKTFSIGFNEAAYDESPHARAVAAHLGTEHTEFMVEPRHALDVIPKLAEWYDEPFADPSQIPTYLVAAMTRKHVTVALSGDGGDEVFAGYNRYFWADSLWRKLGKLPRGLRRAGACAVRQVAPATWDALFRLAPRRWRPPQPGDKMHRFADVLACPGPDAIYRRLVSQWVEPGEVATGGREPLGPLWDDTVAAEIPDFIARMQFLDTVTYLPDDILTKVDRATMAVSLEGRVPLLDHRVVEFAWSLPRHFKLREGRSKWILRQVLARYVPDRLVERPKMGFGVPIDAWLRGPLRDWAQDLLDPRTLRADGLIRPEPVERLWREHQSGAVNWQYPLWVVLMFQAWRRRWPL